MMDIGNGIRGLLGLVDLVHNLARESTEGEPGNARRPATIELDDPLEVALRSGPTEDGEEFWGR